MSGLRLGRRRRYGLVGRHPTGEHRSEYPKSFQTVHIKYRLKGAGLTEKGVEQAIKLSQDKYCSVAATIRGVAEITSEFEILP